MPLFDVLSHVAGTTAVTGMGFVNTSSGVSHDVRINTGTTTVLECKVKTVPKTDANGNPNANATTPKSSSPAPATPAPKSPAPQPKTTSPKPKTSPKPGKKSPGRNVCSDAKFNGIHYSKVVDVGTVVDKQGKVLGSGRPVCGIPLSRSGLYVAVGITGRPTPLPVTRGYGDWVQVSKDLAVPPPPKPVPAPKKK